MAKKKSKQVKAPDYPLSETSPGDRRDWEAEEGYRTLTRAQRITGDRSMMKRVKAHAKREGEMNARIARLEGKLL